MCCLHLNRRTILTVVCRNHVCICVFQTSLKFNCSKDEHCQKHFGSILTNGERDMWLEPFNYPERYRLKHTTASAGFLSHTGAITGVCLKSVDPTDKTEGQCEIQGWCPAEEESQRM